MTHFRWFALATNAMIDFGFVISAFTPLVLLWMWVSSLRLLNFRSADLVIQFRREPSSRCLERFLGSRCLPRTCRLHLASSYGRTCPLQAQLDEERQDSLLAHHQALLEGIARHLYYLVKMENSIGVSTVCSSFRLPGSFMISSPTRYVTDLGSLADRTLTGNIVRNLLFDRC